MKHIFLLLLITLYSSAGFNLAPTPNTLKIPSPEQINTSKFSSRIITEQQKILKLQKDKIALENLKKELEKIKHTSKDISKINEMQRILLKNEQTIKKSIKQANRNLRFYKGL
jgi:translation initiation factor 2B subunit (eIF-2B alpha/beta/delta family)